MKFRSSKDNILNANVESRLVVCFARQRPNCEKQAAILRRQTNAHWGICFTAFDRTNDGVEKIYQNRTDTLNSFSVVGVCKRIVHRTGKTLLEGELDFMVIAQRACYSWAFVGCIISFGCVSFVVWFSNFFLHNGNCLTAWGVGIWLGIFWLFGVTNISSKMKMFQTNLSCIHTIAWLLASNSYPSPTCHSTQAIPVWWRHFGSNLQHDISVIYWVHSYVRDQIQT